jgi:uncharacterized repeat protein (TIGR01451 family)
MKRLLLPFLLFVGAWLGMSPELSATHVMGGDLTYVCQSSCVYRVYQSTFLECGSPLTPIPPATPTNPVISISGGPGCSAPQAISNWVLDSYLEVTPICATVASNCTNSSSTIYGIRQAIFHRDYDFCVAGACTNYTVSWSTCCRNSVVTSGAANDGIYLETNIDLSVTPCNNAPVFTDQPVAYVCSSTGAIVDQSASDIDGDSLIYSLVACRDNGSQFVGYTTGYSSLSPLGNSWNVSIHPTTGQLSILPNPGSLVVGVLCIKVDEYRNGNLIGSVTRDMQVVVINCPIGNNLPQVDSAQILSGGNLLSNWHYAMCEGDTLRLQIDASDIDTTQLLSFSVPSSQAGLSIQATPANPGSAILQFVPGQSGYFSLPVTVKDDNCPVLGQSVQFIGVSVGGTCLSASITDAPCGQAAGAIDLTVGGGTAPYTYSWSNGATTQDLTNILPGSYRVTVTDANGLVFQKTFVVNATNVSLGATLSQPTCLNPVGSISLNPVGGQAPYTYNWSTGDTTSSLSNLPPGGYSVTMRDAVGCPRHAAFILSQPDSCFNVVEGKAYFDQNGNCVFDAGESPIAFAVVDLSPGGATMTDANGNYRYRLDTGSYSLTMYPRRWQTTLCPASGSHNLSWTSYGSVTSNLDFAIRKDSVQELRATYFHKRIRPGDTAWHYLSVYNGGSITMSGTLSWTHDSIFQVVSTNPAFSNYDSTTRTGSWNFFNLPPFSRRVYRLNTRIDSTIPLGQWFTNQVVVQPIAGDTLPANNTVVRTDTTRGSYDPNDKLVTPAGMGALGLLEQTTDQLDYTVRFQNTGTDTAFFVVIRDTIDTNVLDPLSFQANGESHPYSLRIEDDRVLVFRFDNINLPDSNTNLAASQGFVAFSMKLQPNLPAGSQIRNSAAIFFDFNAPIITNTTLNTLFTYPAVSLGNDTSICEGQALQANLTAAGMPPYHFQWSDGSSDPGNVAGVSQTQVQASGLYEVTVVDSFGITTSARVQVTADPLPDADFMATPVGLKVAFSNTATVNSGWLWDFGDGNQASGSPSQLHDYSQNGLYTVTLIVFNDCGADTLTQEVDLRAVALDDDLFAHSVKLVPHPVTEISALRFANPEASLYRLRLIDLQGREVRAYAPTRSDHFLIERGSLAPGVYLYELIGSHKHFGKFVVK